MLGVFQDWTRILGGFFSELYWFLLDFVAGVVLGRIACRYGMTPARRFHNKSQKATKKDTRLAFVSQKERRSTKAATLVDRPTESYRVLFLFSGL